MKPLIVITASYDFPNGPSMTDYAARVGSSYVDAVTAAGGIPVLMAGKDDADLLAHADGVLFSGGVDLDPALYGEEKFNDTVSVCALRDEVELALAKRCFAVKIPVLGICRGIQTLNVALGGSLWQDIPGQKPESIVHASGAFHRADFLPGSWMASCYGTSCTVNSFHHQAVKVLGEGLIATAWSEDGFIEAVEHESLPVYATQWHPERLTGRHYVEQCPDTAVMFSRFVSECAVYSRDRKAVSV